VFGTLVHPAIFATRAVHTYTRARVRARERLRNVNNGESYPEWPTRPMPRGTIVRLLGRGFFLAFQPAAVAAIVLPRTGSATPYEYKPYNAVV